ncbi:ATP-dependent permease PDR12 [Kluyveromyces marxianus DMKU3-1042]|uniref:ATP-dependent permease PDR12 n=1 Tax=Kluyveromyces marxianus (strain DMKU3-1042 / BCC 29191 / NBRC 104275) TaxID=1003335 RepID=W0T7Q4_KLUMD|nr:ATP-dependent permease PDR12 [Kluyveromyces marxianus DMKU3-1042]BAO39657.1 ATP-dependent permease PDR12 [Kluyveromyces marxianus DMKU3-1042]
MSHSSISEGKTNEDGRNSIHSSDSYAHSVASFHLRDDESQNITVQLSNQISHVLSNEVGQEKIESLARVISTKTKKQMESFEVNQLDFDLKALLNYLRSSQLEQGIEPGDSGIAFHDLTAVGIDASAAFGPSVEEMLRSWMHFPNKLWRKMTRQKSETPLRNIIQHCTGVVESGEMLFVVGRPGAGCSTLLKCLSGETSELVEVTGDISYDGLTQEEMMQKFKGYVIYCPELDFHFPKITVKETIDFALKCKTPRSRIDHLSRAQYVDNMRDLWCTVFGLTHTYATKVGNDVVRGVSGGERKRVSLVEALAMNASIYSWDNATRGLDASTALEFAQAIRTATNMMNNSAIVAIYQAGENIYQLFDKTTVLYNGKQVYFGPADEAVGYFERMGYIKPNRMTSAEFLTSATVDFENRTLEVREGYEEKIPKSSTEMEAYWHNSPEYAKITQYFNEYCQSHPEEETRQRLETAKKQRLQKGQREKSQFVVTFWAQVWYCMIRGFQRVKGDSTYTKVYLSSFLIKGLIVGSMFHKIDPKEQSTTEGAYSRGGLLFYVLLFAAVTSLAEISNSFHNRAIVVKHKTYSMYHTSAESLQEIFTEIPTKFVAILILALVSYWIPVLKYDAGSFFQYFLYLFTTQQCTSFTFKLVATLTKDGGTAHAIGGLWVLMLSVYAGFVLPIGNMHHWIRWFHYLNPLTYAYESLMSTEFHGRKMLCSRLLPSGPGYENVSIAHKICDAAGAVAGQLYVSGDAYVLKKYHFRYKHAWRDWGINIVWTFGYIVMNVVMSEYLKPLEGGGDLLLYKRGHMPELGSESVDSKVASREEMMESLNGPGVDLEKVIASKDVFTWNHLNYTIPYDGATRQLLSDVFGYVKPGKMTALMGESGAGKTTLLNVLAQRINVGVITGDMLVNAKPLPPSFNRSCGYVAQADNHMGELSVRESLRFAAELRQPKSVPLQEKYDYVEKIISLLGMEKYAEAIIGKTGRGLNVEQRKKLSIGVELVAKPSLLLFLDEPTSGLDSQSAWSIVQFMRALADSGQSILCTIHQPSATLFEQFDRLLLLKKGGKMVYFGDIGENSSTLLNYFERQSGVKCGKSENPAEYMLNCIGAGATASADADWHDLWLQSPECAAAREEVEELHRTLASRPVTDDKELAGRYAASYLTQMKCVFRRTNIQFWRSPVYIRAKFLECVLCALFVGLSYVGVDHSIAGASQSFASIFMMLLIALAMINQLHVFALDSRELYEVRESASNTFHWSALLICHCVVEIMWSTLCEFLCWICYYWPAQYTGRASHAGYFFLIYVIMFPAYFVSYGCWVFYMSPDVPSASMINSNLFAGMLLFCGILQPRDKMPGFWKKFMYNVSPLTYIVQSLVTPLVQGKKVRCTKNEFAVVNPPEGQTCGQYFTTFIKDNTGYLKNPDDTESCHYCPYSYQQEVVEQYNVRWTYRWRNFGFLWAYIGFNFFAMLACYWVLRVKNYSLTSIFGVFKIGHWKNVTSKPKPRHEKDHTIFEEKAGDAANVKKNGA